jgi:hypothetical protein
VLRIRMRGTRNAVFVQGSGPSVVGLAAGRFGRDAGAGPAVLASPDGSVAVAVYCPCPCQCRVHGRGSLSSAPGTQIAVTGTVRSPRGYLMVRCTVSRDE